MLNDRDDKQEGQEESEYHFSDDDVSYEVETETPKAAPVTEPKEGFLGKLTQSRRMLISIVVFLALLYVVYKMITPATQPVAPPSAITPQVVAASQRPTVSQPMQQQMAQQPQMTPSAVIANGQMQQPVAPVQAVGAQQPQIALTQPMAQPGQIAPSTVQMQMQQPVAPAQQMPAVATQQSMQPSTTQMQMQQPVAPAQQMPAVATQQSMQPSTTQMQMQQPVAPGQQMPQQVTVDAQQLAAQQSAGIPPVMTMNQPVIPQQTPPAAVDTTVATIAATGDQLSNQLQAQYAQKINDYAAQNKALEDQLQTLNSRVASMETQMNQLIQALTRQVQAAPPVPAQPQTDAKIAYNVQAIIPGRAWLRSDSGETVTVAEGDIIKDVGRVTKIDPYDGVVEINIGNKVISLTYGNGS